MGTRTFKQRIVAFLLKNPEALQAATIWDLVEMGFNLGSFQGTSEESAIYLEAAKEEAREEAAPVRMKIAYPRLEAHEHDLGGAELGTVMDDTPKGLPARVHLFHGPKTVYAKAWVRLKKWDWVYVKEVQ